MKRHGPLLKCNSYVQFWISWRDSIAVGLGSIVGEELLVLLPSSKALSRTTYPIKELAVFNGYGASGNWRFCHGKDYIPSFGKNLGKKKMRLEM